MVGMGENSRFWLLAFGRAEKLEDVCCFLVARQEDERGQRFSRRWCHRGYGMSKLGKSGCFS